MASNRAAADPSVIEFTLRAVVAGVLLGVAFGAANAYLGLKVGLTVSTSIPIAVLTVALFRLTSGTRGSTILEANLSQTIGSASSSLATGSIFTLPALFMWGVVPSYMQVVTLAFLGGILGITAMIPLRRLLIVQSADELPYPEGQACAEVLKATASESKGGHWIFWGLALGAGIKILLGGFGLFEPRLAMLVPGLAKAELAIEIAPALFAVGYILGYRSSAVMVSGSLISAVVLAPLIATVGDGLTAPLFPEAKNLVRDMSPGDLWGRYSRYIGAGAVTAAALVTVARALPTMYSSFRAVVKGLRSGASGGAAQAEVERTDRDLPGWVTLAGPGLVVLSLAFIPGILYGDMTFPQRLAAALGVAVFGSLFVVVSSRIVGLIGVSSNPTSGMTLVSLLGVSTVFVLCGWTDSTARAAILTVGTVVAIAASKAGDISQDLKTGQLVGATPAKQQFGQLIGAAFACWAVALVVLLLGPQAGTPDIPAPQATLMRTVIDGVLSGSLPWGLVGTGAGLSLAAMLAGVPGLSFAVGIYLPLAAMTPIFAGGLIRAWVDKRRNGKKMENDPGVLAASGLIAGEGLIGVAIAVLAYAKRQFPDSGTANLLEAVHFNERGFTWLHGQVAGIAGLAVIAGISWFLLRAARDAEA
jgi:putative OPT family oligopeptide transporter